MHYISLYLVHNVKLQALTQLILIFFLYFGKIIFPFTLLCRCFSHFHCFASKGHWCGCFNAQPAFNIRGCSPWGVASQPLLWLLSVKDWFVVRQVGSFMFQSYFASGILCSYYFCGCFSQDVAINPPFFCSYVLTIGSSLTGR